jgi:hypothetical protein
MYYAAGDTKLKKHMKPQMNMEELQIVDFRLKIAVTNKLMVCNQPFDIF